MKHQLWHRSYGEKNFPGYPCPACDDGKLKLQGEATLTEPASSKSQHGFDWWDPELHFEGRFQATLVCDEPDCGEVVCVSGKTDVSQEMDDDGQGWEYIKRLHPKSFFPAPPMITVPDGTPDAVAKEIKVAFAVAWADPNAAANRLRVSIERIMDDAKAPKTVTDKAGKVRQLDLNGRLQWFEKQLAKVKHAETLQTLKRVGNLGSHGSSLKWEDLLATLTVYEDALESLYGDKVALVEKAKAHLALLTAKTAPVAALAAPKATP